jgi:hypothetical protein
VEEKEQTAVSSVSKQKNEIQVYPNPTQSEFSVVSPTPIIRLDVFEGLGRSILSIQANDYRISINSGLWPDGAYFIKAITEKETMHTTIIKN